MRLVTLVMLAVVVAPIVGVSLGVALGALVGALLIAGTLFGAALLIAAQLCAALFFADGSGAVEARIGWRRARRGDGVGIEQVGGRADDANGLRVGGGCVGSGYAAATAAGQGAGRALLLFALVTQGLIRSGGLECLATTSAAHFVAHTSPLSAEVRKHTTPSPVVMVCIACV
jgi:hypothetical protein